MYLQIVQGAGPKNLSFLTSNIAFLVKNVPFAARKAEAHLQNAVEIAKQIGAKGNLGRIYLDLGLLYKTKGKKDKAKKCLSEATELLERCEADVFLRQAKDALASL